MKAVITSSLTALAALSLTTLTPAHFLMLSPPSSGFEDAKIATFPCSGFDTVQTNRTLFPISNGQIALEMADSSSDIEVLIGLGNNVGNGFNQVIRQTFSQKGEGNFCMTGFQLPAGMAGMNATIQAVTSNENGGRLYNCADVTLSAMNFTVTATDACTNATGATTGISSIVGNLNNTAPSATGREDTHKRERVLGRTVSLTGRRAINYVS